MEGKVASRQSPVARSFVISITIDFVLSAGPQDDIYRISPTRDQGLATDDYPS
jgi:hypothetical protein